MIDFPLNPVHGSTYSYLDIQYTFYKPGATEGYWRVSTPATVGIATPTEINEGTDNAKYITPQGLDGSKYVREDEATGETVLSAGGLERLRTTTTGTALTGKLLLDGDIEKDGNTVPVVVDAGRTATAWYRKWSDGFIEQGGYIDGLSVSAGDVIFATPFGDTRYALALTISRGLGAITMEEAIQIQARTTTKTRWASWATHTTYGNIGAYSWTASGF